MLHIRSLRTWVAGFVLITAATAAAQDPEFARNPDQPTPTSAPQGIDPGAEKTFEQAKVYVQKMQGVLKRGEKQRQTAQEQKDLVKLNCLNEKMNQATAHVKDAERALSDLGDAVVRSDTTGRLHEFSRIRIFYQKVLVLQAEANSCAGEDAGFVGPSQIEVEVDPTIPQGDPTDPGLPTPDNAMAPPGTEQAVQSSPVTPPTVEP